ncbi:MULTISPECIES: sensor histidine kinase [Paenibacillus]|uniref:sensor histidine kinase n=1 Tax=Paenibacillus TaxID=44249 RepID=UPI0009A5B748|nr:MULTISPECIES: histidine kinase [unclassified Paenibacillus]SLK10149.1 two-component system, sensor histidine kinase YesM [Paenibacillus sp. RU5A]SOC71894.1 two-component system, sensor histidine kinase YesM [Paenibacillus sp. RU26A]SOC74249.1 two-component system, sensor histidine kinase YesM [Paenibacillus sp. RU5M]
MIGWIKSKFNDIRFRNKLLLSHLVIALIPILLLGLLSFIQSYRIQMKELRSEAEASLEQVANIMDYKINRYNTLSEFMVLNRDLSQIFTKDYEDNYYNMYLDFRDILEPLISNIRLMDDDIEGITFYTSGELLGIRNNILPIGDLKSKAWYDGFRGRRWIVDGEKLYLVQELISNPKDSNFMVISIQHDSIFADLDNLSEHVAVHIEDAKQHVIFQENQKRVAVAAGSKVGESGDLSLSRSLANNGWTIHYNLLNTNAYANAMSIFQITLFVIILSLVITFLLIYVISNNFTQRIIHIKNKVDKVERNNLDVIIRSSSRDEFGELTNGIGKMLTRINSLISQVYHAEIAKKESEYNKLISQINPHFLYNTLSFIRWRAEKKADIETSYMVSALARFYRTTLNQGKNMATIEAEVQHIKAYLDLQLIMNDGRFDVDYHINDEVLHTEVIHFILQPIVENAIKHGFVEADAIDYRIHITVNRVGEGIKLTVCDNGVGMTPMQTAGLLTGENGGCGVRNVNDRIKLYYGRDYGLVIHSEPGSGTEVSIVLPAT